MTRVRVKPAEKNRKKTAKTVANFRNQSIKLTSGPKEHAAAAKAKCSQSLKEIQGQPSPSPVPL